MDVPLVAHGDAECSVPVEAPRERYVVLFLFSSVALAQSLSWNFFGPISGSIKDAYGWSDSTIAWMANTANISMLCSIPFSASLASRASLRHTIIMCALFMLGCTLLRIMPSLVHGISSKALLWVQYSSMVCNGLAAAFLNFGGPLISSQFFPAAERATATAIASVMCYAGVAIGFVLGPLCVKRSADISRLYFGEFIYTATVTVLVIALFPCAPSTAPSPSSAVLQKSKEDMSGSSELEDSESGNNVRVRVSSAKLVRLWVVAIAASLPLGVFSGWGSVLSINLQVAGMDQTEAGWLGFWMTLTGCVAAVLAGMLGDRFMGRLKKMTLLSFLLATAAFLSFALLVEGGSRSSHGRMLLYASGIAGGVFVNAPIPLCFEMASEVAFPDVPVAFASSVLSLLNTVVQILFLALSFVGSGGTSWMNWLMVLVLPASALPLLFMRLEYDRLRLDVNVCSTESGYQQKKSDSETGAVTVSLFDAYGW